MSSAVTQPSWIVQILFGRYQSVSTLSWTNVIIVAVAGLLMIYIYLFFLRRRFRAYDRLLKRIPLTALPLTTAHTTKRQYRNVVRQLVRAEECGLSRIIPANNSGVGIDGGPVCGDGGWGADATHYTTSVAKSWFALERTAVSRRPGLAAEPYRTVRDYVSSLRLAFPALPPAICEEYVRRYEDAMFGQHKVSEQGQNSTSHSLHLYHRRIRRAHDDEC